MTSSKDSVQSMRKDVKDFIILCAANWGNSISPWNECLLGAIMDAFKSPKSVKTKCDDEWE